MENLTKGTQVHYVQPSGAHSAATVTHVHNKETGVVDLNITSDDAIKDDYNASTVVYSHNPIPYTWHFVEEDEPKSPEQSE